MEKLPVVDCVQEQILQKVKRKKYQGKNIINKFKGSSRQFIY